MFRFFPKNFIYTTVNLVNMKKEASNRKFKVLTYVDPFSFATIFMILMAVRGLIEGIIFSTAEFPVEWGIAQLGYIMIILTPAVYAVLGFILGIFIAGIYNFLAKKIGGIKFEMQ